MVNSLAHESDTSLVDCYIHGIAWHVIVCRFESSEAHASRLCKHWWTYPTCAADLCRENDSRHLSQPVTTLYGSSCFVVRSEANHLQVTVVASPTEFWSFGGNCG